MFFGSGGAREGIFRTATQGGVKAGTEVRGKENKTKNKRGK